MENQENTQNENVAPDVWGGTTNNVIQEQPIESVAPEEVTAPVADEPVVAPVVEPKPDAVVEPTIQERTIEIEKIVEKYPEFKDDYSKQIYEAILTGKEDELKSYFDEKFRDYSTMSDRENIEFKLKKENPSWTPKDIDSEIKFKYGKNFSKVDMEDMDEDDDRYERSLAHNEDVERREMLMERDARDARLFNTEQKKTIELPKIPTQEAPPQLPQKTQEEIDESIREWESKVAAEVPNLSDFKFDVDGAEVVYKITDQDKSALSTSMKDFEVVNYLTARGWFDAEGKPNVKAITEDVYKLDNLSKIIASTSTQMKTASKKEIVSEIKNLDLTPSGEAPDQMVDVAALIWGQ